MNPIRSLWASIQGNPILMQRLNGWLTILWVGMIPVSIALSWLDSVRYVSALSLWALVSGHWSAYQAARVEVRQEEIVAAAEVRHPLLRSGAPRVRVRRVAGHRRPCMSARADMLAP
jgi:hypothetical protein